MLRRTFRIALAAASIFTAAPVLAQGIGHTFFMRGSIVGSDSSGTVVCIGRADGAEVGQTLDVFRVTYRPGPSKGAVSNYTRELVGHVQISHVFDDHFAHVTVVDGRPKKHDIVELQRPAQN
jgi:hypothetical protein